MRNPVAAALAVTSVMLASWAIAPAALAHPARVTTVQDQGHDPAECACRAEGRTFSLGQTTCLRTSEGPRLAQCGMVLNNTSWRFTDRNCPES